MLNVSGDLQGVEIEAQQGPDRIFHYFALIFSDVQPKTLQISESPFDLSNFGLVFWSRFILLHSRILNTFLTVTCMFL